MRVLIDLTALGIVARFRSESCIEIIIEADFYFHTSLCASKGFMKALKAFIKPFWGTTKKCENKSLT